MPQPLTPTQRAERMSNGEIAALIASHGALVTTLKAAQSYIETPGDLSAEDVRYLQEDIEIALSNASKV